MEQEILAMYSTSEDFRLIGYNDSDCGGIMYVTATSATCQVVWMRRMLKDLL